MLRRVTALGLLSFCTSCRPGVSAPAEGPRSAEQCSLDRKNLVELLESLPEQGLGLRGRADLPVASLGGVIGSGRVVDVAGDVLRIDGEPVEGQSSAERLDALSRRLDASPVAEAGVPRPLIYLAVPGEMDVRALRSHLAALPRSHDVHLVFRARAQESAGAPASSVSERLLSETDLGARHALARDTYRLHARCEPVQTALDGVAAGDPSERWPELRSALLAALPSCDCRDLDTEPLRELLLAEQRAGAASVGSVPFDFMRDERCGASYGLSPVQKVIEDIASFDEEFAGQYGHESVDFSQVVTNERLLNYLCPALPGETLMALARAQHTFYWKVRGLEGCQAWQLEPLAPGSVMGTWRRKGPERPLALHYWQGAEEIRLFGPVSESETSRPTDERAWACDEEFRLRGIDAESITLETGRWFFDQAACEQASEEEAAFPGCIAALAGGPPEVPPAVPATFPALGDGRPEPTEQ